MESKDKEEGEKEGAEKKEKLTDEEQDRKDADDKEDHIANL